MMLPICVDLDGTLIHDDVTIIALKDFLRRNVFHIFPVIAWFCRGRAYLKHQLAQRVDLNAEQLNYNQEFLNYLREKKKEGHKLFLATACNRQYADAVADYLQIFDGVFASDSRHNLRAEAKANALTLIFGEKGFIYAGNSKDDLKVWRKSAEYILVTPTAAALNGMRGKSYTLFN